MDENQYRRIKNASMRNWLVRTYLDSRYSTNKTGWNSWAFNQIVFPPKARLLELGCGSAELWTRTHLRIPKDATLILSDFSKKTIHQTRRALGSRAGRFGFSVVNAEQIPFADESFDIVVANRMLYFTDLKITLPEICRVLKPGGKLYAATVGTRNMIEIIDLYFSFFSVEDRTRRTVADIFGLENGCGILQHFFSNVEIRRFENELLVDGSEPLIEYLRTAQSIDRSYLTPEGIRKLRDHLNGIIRRQGHFKITKDAGIFVAEK
jgi:Methylase involved in ubiquinone/menaquinone biosynthesis